MKIINQQIEEIKEHLDIRFENDLNFIKQCLEIVYWVGIIKGRKDRYEQNKTNKIK